MAKRIRPSDIRATLREGIRHDLVILAIPSHDRHNKLLNQQELFTDEAMRLFADLYGGATAVTAYKGVYLSTEGPTQGEYLWDNPLLVQSYCDREYVEDLNRLQKLLQFIRAMKRSLDQECVLLIVNEYRWFV